jgi:hypothetical protein
VRIEFPFLATYYGVCVAGHRIKTMRRNRFDRWWAKHDLCENPEISETFEMVGGGILRNVHPRSECAGRTCVVHNPSDHLMRDWPMIWRSDKGLMERACPHGIGHPDPDDLYYKELVGGPDMRKVYGIHGCDGCCS